MQMNLGMRMRDRGEFATLMEQRLLRSRAMFCEDWKAREILDESFVFGEGGVAVAIVALDIKIERKEASRLNRHRQSSD